MASGSLAGPSVIRQVGETRDFLGVGLGFFLAYPQIALVPDFHEPHAAKMRREADFLQQGVLMRVSICRRAVQTADIEHLSAIQGISASIGG